MKIFAFFTNEGVPIDGSGITVTIDVYKFDSTLVVNGATMTQISDGAYYYDFTAYDEDEDYFFIADAGVTLSNNDRYNYGTNSNNVNEQEFTLIKGSGFSTENLKNIRDAITITDGKVDTVDTVVDAIKLKTDNLPADPASETNATINTGSIVTEVNANETKIDSITSTLSGLVASIWSYSSRTLTSFGTLVYDIWNYTTRTITSGGISASEVWSYVTRTLTGIGTSGIASEANASSNKTDIISEINNNETKIDTIDANVDLIKAQTDKLPRLLGLMQENQRITSPVYNTNNLLTSATIKIYSSASDCNADTNAIATYAMTATYNDNGEMTSYKVVKN